LEESSKEHMVNDIENRLDDFFDDSTPTPSETKPAVSLEKLKSVVLSIDWEITEACLTDLVSETDNLLPSFQEDRISHALLRMLRAVGRYIRRHKAQAHPDAIKRIMSVFSSLEKIIDDPQMTEALKKEIVAREIAAFKRLKQQVEAQYGAAADAQNVAGSATDNDPQDFKQAVIAVEQRLNSQVADLKEQLAILQKELDSIRTR
jgi:phosphoenolpyruvate-protein kinase (PTS system EI component)